MPNVTYFPVTRVIDGQSMTLFAENAKRSCLLRQMSDEEFVKLFNSTTVLVA